MSEPIAGLEAPRLPAPTPRPAAVVVLYRVGADGLEVFWLRREQKLSFAGGFHAFPGGKVERGDAAQEPTPPFEGVPAGVAACALRELEEEAGVRLPGPSALLPAGRWVTPPYLPVRFDTHFFLAELPHAATAAPISDEATQGGWIRLGVALGKWARGEVLLHPPQVHALTVLDGFTTPAAAARALASPPHCDDFVCHRIEFQRGVKLYPLDSHTLPPAQHTNCYVLGTGDALVVDPGGMPEAIPQFLARLADLRREGVTVQAVVLTHHHGDHVAGAKQVAAALGAPIWAHRLTAERLPGLAVARHLNEGDVLELGGPWPMAFRAVHTPGHAPGHVCLVDECSKAAIVGDMVAGVGTIVIEPEDGDMAEYLRQLARLRGLVGALYPAHGPVLADGVGKLDEYLAHRAWREGKVVAALEALQPTALGPLVERAYDDVQAFIWPLAERNTLAILKKLSDEGRARSTGGAWALGAPPR